MSGVTSVLPWTFEALAIRAIGVLTIGWIGSRRAHSIVVTTAALVTITIKAASRAIWRPPITTIICRAVSSGRILLDRGYDYLGARLDVLFA